MIKIKFLLFFKKIQLGLSNVVKLKLIIPSLRRKIARKGKLR